MKYNLDLVYISLQKYKDILKGQNLLPGRKILIQNVDDKFLWFEKKGIINVAQLKKCISNSEKISLCSFESGITEEYWEANQSSTNELFCLCDLVRINGIGPVAAKAFYKAGYQSVSEVSEAEASLLLERVSAVNQIEQYYKAKLGIKDMQFCIDFAKLIKQYENVENA